MSISAVSSGSSYTPAPPNPIRQDFNRLSKALQANDLSGAQKAFADLEQALSAAPPPPGSSSGQTTSSSGQTGGPLGQDLQNLGKALAAGDLKGAQTSFAQLTTDLTAAASGGKKTGHAHGHHGGDKDGDKNGGAASTTTPPDSTASTNSQGNISLLA